MPIEPYLNFDGRCREAFEYYARHLDGKIEMLMTFGESPMAETFPDAKDKVMHAHLRIAGGHGLAGSDACGAPYNKPQGFAVALSVNDGETAERYYKALSERGSVEMPLQKTFWTSHFAMLTDQFGVPWMINKSEEMQ